MCYDLNEYDPFEAIAITDYGDEEEIYSEPMNDDDWEEWLAND